MKKIIILSTLIALCFGQIQRGGTPKYFGDLSFTDINFISTEGKTVFDRDFHPMVFQYGTEYIMDVNFIDEAQVTIEDNMYTFTLGVSSYGAYGIGFSFSEFYLTESAELYFYDRERTDFLGALTSLNNKGSESMTTSIVKGSDVIIELTVPKNELSNIKLHLSSVIHDREDIMNYYNTLDENPEDCNLNVICPEGDDWREQINGVV